MSELDAALVAAAAEKDREEWLAVRGAGFGCSDLGALWLILGWAGEDVFDWHEDAEGEWRSDLYTACPRTGERDYVTPRYLMESWRTMKKCGLPRLIAEKAGAVKPRAQSDAQAEGLHKERALFEQSRLGRWDVNAYYAQDESSLAFVPEDWQKREVSYPPLVVRDSVEPRLLCTVEAWEYQNGRMVAWELKTDRLGLRTKPPWAQRLQAIGQAVVLGAEFWGIQYGPEWAKADSPSFPDLRDPVQWGPYPVRDEDRMMIRRGVRLGWAMVEKAKEGR